MKVLSFVWLVIFVVSVDICRSLPDFFVLLFVGDPSALYPLQMYSSADIVFCSWLIWFGALVLLGFNLSSIDRFGLQAGDL